MRLCGTVLSQEAAQSETSIVVGGGNSLPPGPASPIKASSAAVMDGKFSLKSVLNPLIAESENGAFLQVFANSFVACTKGISPTSSPIFCGGHAVLSRPLEGAASLRACCCYDVPEWAGPLEHVSLTEEVWAVTTLVAR